MVNNCLTGTCGLVPKKIYFIMENLKFNLNDLKNKLSRLQMRDVIGGYNWATGRLDWESSTTCISNADCSRGTTCERAPYGSNRCMTPELKRKYAR